MKQLCVLILASTLAACATPEVVDVHKVGDNRLNCQQLQEQFVEAQDFEKKARREKGATGTNVAAFLLFWPAMIATYSNVDEAVTAAKDRQERLQKIAAEKGCKI
ncbi:MAG: hypothetical protein OXU75_21005 [Deltaproteobacteria bacterium]|nr:hypothetical protein [Deltaproteobacteria bacterium]